MASRILSYWRTVASRQFVTSTSPRMNPASQAKSANPQYGESHTRSTKRKGDFVPIYVALGLILMSVSFGVHTAKNQIAYSPAVRVSKKRRETVPEVVEPDRVVEEADKFVNKSLFRKVGHIQDFDAVRAGIADPSRPDPFAHTRRVESLKSVGVDPQSH